MFGDTSRSMLEDELYDSEESVKLALKTTATRLTAATSKIQCTLHKSLRDYHGFIRVQVGHDTVTDVFEVHQALITGRSKFFKAALSGSWLESKERVVKLPEDDPTTFHVYVHLLYTNEIAILPDPNPKTFWTDGARNIRLAKLYVLAEKLHDIETKNHVLEAVIAGDLGEGAYIGMDYPRRLFVKIIYDGTAAGSLARKLIVDVYARQMTSISMGIISPRYLKEWPKEFLDELLLEVLDRRVLVPGKLSEADASKYKE